jgi:hypothetical protein
LIDTSAGAGSAALVSGGRMRSRRPSPALRSALAAIMPLSGGALALALVACGSDATAPTTGAIHVTVTTTGAPADPDGYVLTVDGGAEQALGANADLTVDALAPGAHTVALSSVAANCTVAELASRTVTVTAGETATVAFALTCAQGGSVNVTTATTGSAPDADGYTVTIDQGPPQPIGADATVAIADVAPGSHFVTLAGLAANCHTPDENPRVITVMAGGATGVTFAVFCPGP